MKGRCDHFHVSKMHLQPELVAKQIKTNTYFFAMAIHGFSRRLTSLKTVTQRGERMHIASHVPSSKYGFSLDRNSV